MAAGKGEGEAIKLFGKTITLDRRQVIKEEQGRITAEQMAEKRPDKIIPCPRCKSMETKFCYFNNYNVNQPRHFCRGCQRYWTAGGALRDVPVGAGRRKTKPPGLSLGGFHQIEMDGVVLEDWQMAAYGGFRYVLPGKRLKSTSGQHEDQ